MNTTEGPLEMSIPIENGKQVAMLVTSAFSIVISTVLVALRFWARRIVQRALDASDLCILAALLFTISLHIDMYIMVLHGGFGNHVVDIIRRFGNNTLVLFLKGILAFPILWSFTVCFSKLSVLLMYMAIFPVRRMVVACQAVGLFIIFWNTGGILGALLLCRPIALNWNRSIDGHCGNQRLFYMWLGSINVVAEAVILLLPVPFLYRLQMQTFKKLVVIGLFSVGWMTCAVTIYRQVTLPHLYFEDMTYTGALATIFSGIEPAVALSLACVPFLRPLIRGKNIHSDTESPYASHTIGSRGMSGSKSRPFEELDDNNSELQLQPLDSSALKYEAEVGRGHQQTAGSAGSIVIKKDWSIVTRDRHL